MDKELTDNTKACRYELRFDGNGDITVRLVPPADHGAHTRIPKAMTRKDATDTETPPPTNRPTIQP